MLLIKCPSIWTQLLLRTKNLILEIFSKQTFNVENLTIAMVVTDAICCLDYFSFPFTDLWALLTLLIIPFSSENRAAGSVQILDNAAYGVNQTRSRMPERTECLLLDPFSAGPTDIPPVYESVNWWSRTLRGSAYTYSSAGAHSLHTYTLDHHCSILYWLSNTLHYFNPLVILFIII